MTGGIFMMSNLEGLFAPWRDLEAEMDELRTMRRVSQIWNEMESRERGAWTMYSRFLDTQMDDDLHSWGSGLFSGLPSHRHRHTFNDSYSSNKSDSNVIVEFPDDKEIKIELEEPSVVITEVVETPEQTEPVPMPSRSSPVRKSSLINSADYNIPSSESENNIFNDPSNSTNINEIHISRTVDVNGKSEKIEKRCKKVDFSKMEVHFEPGSGRVNIVETNGKPPSNQLFRRKRRHREKYRSGSPKLHFVGSSPDIESYENMAPPLDNSCTVENFRFTELQSDSDLSIFSLRNSLFKNTDQDIKNIESKNVQKSQSSLKYNRSKEQMKKENILSDKNIISNYSHSRTSFNVSSKLQNMIQNSLTSDVLVDKNKAFSTKGAVNESKNNSVPLNSGKVERFTSDSAPGNTLKGKINSLKRNNVRVKNNTSSTEEGYNIESKLSTNEKPVYKTKVPVIRGDSFKKSSRISRQESVKSNSSRGSNGDNKIQKKYYNSKSNDGRISRTPSFSKFSSNSLKKGGIYIDAKPKKISGSSVTMISYLNNNSVSQHDKTLEKLAPRKSVDNNVNTSRNKVIRKESFRSSKESLSSLSNRFAQKKNNELKESFSRSKQQENLLTPTYENKERTRLKKLNFVGRSLGSNDPGIPKSTTVNKKDSFRNDSSSSRLTGLRSRYQIKNQSVMSVGKTTEKDERNKDQRESLRSKAFHHENSSLFQPIKKEKSIHSSDSIDDTIKTPIAIRKSMNTVEAKRGSQTNEKLVSHLPTRNRGVSDYIKRASGSSSKLNFVSLRRSKEPLRSFEKISNGWVGRCNMLNLDSDSTVNTEWPVKKVADMKSNINTISNEKSKSVESISPVSQISSGSRTTVHQQRESMIRLSQGFPSKTNSSAMLIAKNVDTRKRPARNVYTPTISPQSFTVPVSKRKHDTDFVRASSNTFNRADNAEPTSEPLYETLNSRRNAPSSASRGRRVKQTNPCCNI